jgi:F420-non-reducing hydrogenase iron-sulfur subunit
MSGGAPSGSPGRSILVFSTKTISDPGIDLAGSQHRHYPPSVVVLPVPCSSAVKPRWVLHALRQGFDGVFIAADGSDCAYTPSCTEHTAGVVQRSQDLMREAGLEPKRLKMAAICSVCAEPFEGHMESFHELLSGMEPILVGGEGSALPA